MSASANPAFARYIGIDYSGAATPRSSLKGLRVFLADRATLPEEVLTPPSQRKYSLTCRYCGAEMTIIAFVIETPSALNGVTVR